MASGWDQTVQPLSSRSSDLTFSYQAIMGCLFPVEGSLSSSYFLTKTWLVTQSQLVFLKDSSISNADLEQYFVMTPCHHGHGVI